MKYHINPETGNPNQCRATKKRGCPYKTETGETVEHYESKEAARIAFEETQSTAERLKGVSKTSTPRGNKEGIYSKAWGKKLQNTSRRLVNIVSDPIVLKDMKEYGVLVDGFRMIGDGMESFVFVDENEDYVYKIPSLYPYYVKPEHKDLGRIALENAILDQRDALNGVKKLQKAYAGYSMAAAETADVEYATTYFLEVEDKMRYKVPVMVQEYLNPEQYEFSKDLVYDGSPLERELEAIGFTDVHSGNLCRRRSDGKIILFDCLSNGF